MLSDKLESTKNAVDRNSANRAAEALASKFQTVITDAEELLRATANYSADGFGAVRAKLEDQLRDAKSSLHDAKGMVAERTERAAVAAEEYVTENPWKAIAIVASVSLLIGMLASRR
jgi:ElaB/YqjD/DUF883 family membrane-anchored ribosome-binding protein